MGHQHEYIYDCGPGRKMCRCGAVKTIDMIVRDDADRRRWERRIGKAGIVVALVLSGIIALMVL